VLASCLLLTTFSLVSFANTLLYLALSSSTCAEKHIFHKLPIRHVLDEHRSGLDVILQQRPWTYSAYTAKVRRTSTQHADRRDFQHAVLDGHAPRWRV